MQNKVLRRSLFGQLGEFSCLACHPLVKILKGVTCGDQFHMREGGPFSDGMTIISHLG